MKVERINHNSPPEIMAVWSVTLSCGTNFTMLSQDLRSPEKVAAAIRERFPRENKKGVSDDSVSG